MSGRPALVPELMVTDLAASLAFWRGLCGFRVLFDRPEEGFACVERDGGARVMLDQLPRGRPHRWEAAPAEPPFGRHVNFEIAVDDASPRWTRRAGPCSWRRKRGPTDSAEKA